MKTESQLYQVLEDVLRKSEKPLTCVEMFEFAEVRKYAQSSNRVSDYLGGLWRKGKVIRMPAPSTDSSAARWAYAWKKIQRRHQGNAVEYIDKKRARNVHQEGNDIVIELPDYQIRIRSKHE